MTLMSTENASKELLSKLAQLSRKGPVPAVGTGDTAVGMTLLDRLGIPYSSTKKPNFNGIVITARRGSRAKDVNRVNLFAKVPDWSVSECKSSKEIVERCGYERIEGMKLYCTVSAKQPNRQGLYLELDYDAGFLREQRRQGSEIAPIAAWRLDRLAEKLRSTHAESAWVIAVPSWRDGLEHFHFRYVTFTSAPRVEELAGLLEQGTITMDHLISSSTGRVIEKGPLFKIKPENVSALFPVSRRFDLLSI